ncbi:MAG: hypothetical protein PF487_03475 [Bacteroidales bacterium]|jgi:hypothetical protein|nr:hypothetical protein [Bacteroidales bacterium]
MRYSIEQYQNLVDLLKQALYFYSNEENYNGTKNSIALVAIDKGHQARFALKQINELDDINENVESDYNDLINDVEKEESSENIIKIIDKIKEIGNED